MLESTVQALPLAAAFVAFCISAAVTPLVRYFARRHGFVAHPRPDRWHGRPTALLGGVAVYLAIALPLLLFPSPNANLLLLAAGATGVFALGLVDDLVKLRPYQKLVGQIAVASLVSAGGVTFQGLPLSVLAVPLTILWFVAIINAFNLLDNMDGLSAGIACVTGLVLAGIGLVGGNGDVAMAGGLVAGSAAGFLLYNSSPASIFMGDSGSMVLGFVVGGLAVLGSGYGTPQNVLLTVVVPIAVLGVPLFDTALVSVVRTLYGRPISQGGRDHTSHRLVALGLSEKQTVWVLYSISAAFGAFALATRFVDVLLSAVIFALLAVGLGLFGVYLAQVKVYREQESGGVELASRPQTLIGGNVMHKMRLFEVSLDLVLIVVGYLGAYLLKFEGTLSGTFLEQFTESLPFVIVLKLATFLLAGVYGGVWRHAGLPEVVAFGRASTLGSVLCVIAVAALWRFEGYSKSVFVIDWLLFTWLVILSRMSFRLLTHSVQSLAGTNGSQPNQSAAAPPSGADRPGVRIHPTAEVADSAEVGAGTRIWHQAQVRDGAVIGRECILGKGAFVDANVHLGDRCKLQNSVFVFHGFSVEDGVFLGPGVMLLNDKNPRAIKPDGTLQSDADWIVSEGRIGYGAAVGGGAVVLPGVNVGRFALVGSGAVVTRDVPDHGIVYGNPARLTGFACRCGRKLTAVDEDGETVRMRCDFCGTEVEVPHTAYRPLSRDGQGPATENGLGRHA